MLRIGDVMPQVAAILTTSGTLGGEGVTGIDASQGDCLVITLSEAWSDDDVNQDAAARLTVRLRERGIAAVVINGATMLRCGAPVTDFVIAGPDTRKLQVSCDGRPMTCLMWAAPSLGLVCHRADGMPRVSYYKSVVITEVA